MENNKFNEAVILLQQLIQIPSPYFEEEKAIDYVYQWLTDNHIPAQIHEYRDDKVTKFSGKNVLSVIDSGRPGPVIHLNGHIDTVKLCQGWSKDPFDGTLEDGRIYGLGALDMKSGCTAIMSALKEFLKDCPSFCGKIISAFVSDEEGPFGLGTSAIIADGYLDDVDVSISTEPSAGFTKVPFPCVCLGARGSYGLSVEFFGTAAHAANPHLGVNAAIEAGKLLTNLDQIRFREDDFLGKGCVCPISMEADGGACSVPDYAKVGLFWHLVRGDSKEWIVSELERVLALAGVQCEYRISFRQAPTEATDVMLPYAVSPDDPYVTRFMDAVRDVAEDPMTVNFFQSNGDFNYLGTLLDAPCIIFGAAGSNHHSPDEYATEASVRGTAAVLYTFLKDTLATQ